MQSARDAPSIVLQGAWNDRTDRPILLKELDPGAPAWQTEAWLKLIHHQYFGEKTAPLWNPDQGYGQPLAANMQSQPFYPLTIALAIHVTPRTYNWFLLLRLFIAGMSAYLYARWFLSFFGALAAAIGCMFGGYYILFLAMPHLSVEVLLPLGLLAAEYTLRRPGFRSFLLFSAAIFLAITGGMPESAFLLFCFVYSYWLFRILTDSGLRSTWRRRLAILGSATAAGLCLSMFLLLPFAEYLKNSSNSHGASYRTGMQFDKFDLSAATYILPMLFGLPHSDMVETKLAENTNYLGVISVFLTLVALGCVLRGRRFEGAANLRKLTLFFAGFGALLLLKRFGVEPVYEIGRLPLFSFVDFRKYGEPILSTCVALLAGIGVEWLIHKGVSRPIQIVCAAATVVVAGIALLPAWDRVEQFIIESDQISPPLWAVSFAGAALGLIVLTVVVTNLVFKKQDGRLSIVLGISWLSLVSIQAACSYIVPAYRILSRLPMRSNNPYAGAPFVDYLKAKASGHDRIFAREGVLISNWAAVFGLYDIRDLDAMYVGKYFPFLDSFFSSYRNMGPELESCFRGLGPFYDFAHPLERRLLQLSSVRYIGTESLYTTKEPVVDEILKQNEGHIAPGKQPQIGHADLIVNGELRPGLGEHPPYARLPYRVKLGNDKSEVFHFAYGMNPRVYEKGGDGVGFTLEVKDQAGNITQLFSRYIDPKHNPQDRGLIPGEVDLTRYRGQTVDLLFSTDPGPKGDSAYDWAAWTDLRFNDRPPAAAKTSFHPVYDGDDARIFEYDDILPRASVFYRAEVVKSGDVLRRLTDPSLDIFQTVVVNSDDVDPNAAGVLTTASQVDAPRVEAAQITSYSSQSVSIEASPGRPAILMLNDTAYPGWTVEVDGRAAKWFAADYLFRGVMLNAGRHSVRFVYRPKSFYWGLGISAIAAMAIVSAGFLAKHRGRSGQAL